MNTSDMTPKPFVSWPAECVFNRPASLNSVPDSAAADIKVIQPFRVTSGGTVNGDKPIASPVVGLSFFCRPYAIVMAIMAVVIRSFYSVLWGRFQTHINEEVFKGTQPPVTNGNDSTSVIFIRWISLICAALDHPGPRVVLGSVSKAMGGVSRYGFLSANAPTICCVSLTKIPTPYNRCISTVAQAVPSKPFELVSSFNGYCCEFTKSLPCKVDCFHRYVSKIKGELMNIVYINTAIGVCQGGIL